MTRWPEKAHVRSIHQNPTGRWSALVVCPDGVARRFRTARDPEVTEWVKRPQRRPVRDRYAVLARDHFTCRYCGARAPGVELRVDHVIPLAKGGTDDPSNLVTACEPCNSGKSDGHSGGVVDPSDALHRSRLERGRDAMQRMADGMDRANMAANKANDQ